MEKKVISHIFHEHLLFLRQHVREDSSPNCYRCGAPVADSEMAYVCTEHDCRDRAILHKKCGELPNQISNPNHSRHPLNLFYFNMLNDDAHDVCTTCSNVIRDVFGYRCSICNFNLHIECAEATVEEREELRHPSHPHHSLTLIRKPRFSFFCDGCGDEDEDMAYICGTCEFMLHKRCALSSPDILRIDSHHHHPLSLIFSLPKKHRKYRYKCDVCNKYCDALRWAYFCGECRYIVHVRCAIRSSTTNLDVSNLSEDDGDVIEFPIHANDISDKLIKPFVMREKGLVDTISTSSSTSTNTSYLLEYYHEHPLRYVSEFIHKDEEDEEEDDDEEDIEEESKICDVCITPIPCSTPYYECATSTCTYSIHSICSLLPHTLKHSSSSYNTRTSLLFLDECGGIRNKNHNFTLYKSKGRDAISGWNCDLCHFHTNGMGYECGDCRKKIDVKCASLPTSIRHASHTRLHGHHKPLTFTRIHIDSGVGWKLCYGCNRRFYYYKHAYRCNVDGCDFALHLRCVVLPSSVTNPEQDKHQLLLLTSDVSRDHPSDFFCEICEKEMHPKNWMYHCRQCDASFHRFCLDTGSGAYRNMKLGRRYEFEGIHPNHHLTFTCVTLKKHCDLCHEREFVYTYLGFECATCYYVLCEECGLKKLEGKGLKY